VGFLRTSVRRREDTTVTPKEENLGRGTWGKGVLMLGASAMSGFERSQRTPSRRQPTDGGTQNSILSWEAKG